jgi:Protein of unknown function (DUF3995)
MGPRSTFPAWATFWWGLVFGGLNLYWSAGGEFLLNHLGKGIQQDVAEGDTALLVINTIGGLGKIALGCLALGTIARWGRRIPRRLHLGLLYTAGALLVLYGGASWTQMLLVELGVVDVPRSIGEEQVQWYLFLWEPAWILAGVLVILTAEAYRRR